MWKKYWDKQIYLMETWQMCKAKLATQQFSEGWDYGEFISHALVFLAQKFEGTGESPLILELFENCSVGVLFDRLCLTATKD